MPEQTSTPYRAEAGGLTIRNMRTFFWLARLRNFHAVARQVGVTQPAITSRIASLEDELGVQLFSRDRQVITLTPEGQDALRLCESALEKVDDILVRFPGTGERAGVVRIGVIDTVARTWLPTVLNRVQAEFPNIILEITNESTVALHSMLRSGVLSMSITISPCDEVDVINTEIGRYAVEWVASDKLVEKDHTYTVEELTRLPLIGYIANSPPARLMQQYFGDAMQTSAIRNTTNSMSTMIWLAENGLGIAAIPPRAIHQHLQDSRLVIVKAERSFRPMSFFLNCRNRPYSPVVQTVEALVREVAEQFTDKQVR
jgi:DNA-binding transcriptional LysR family regulator